MILFDAGRSSRPELFYEKGVLRNFAKFIEKQSCDFIKTETLARMFSCKFYEICKNTFFYRTHLGECFYAGKNSKYFQRFYLI